MNWNHLDISIAGLNKHYRENDFKPRDLINHLVEKSRQYSQKNIWIHLLTEDEIQPYLEALEEKTPDNSPLYGVPFAIKDNIDLAGIPTTAACPEFAYTPEHHAFVVQTLIEAGAVPIGKTNLDQFATGLVGTRSPEPWGACRNAFDDDYISGGSSSGSAVAVSLGLASFSLGTDTAGSGRVPAALNNLFGLKPSKGLLSTSGVVPACRSLDVVSIFALSADDAGTVFEIAAAYDEQDCYARKNPYKNTGRTAGIGTGVLRLGVPRSDQLEFFGDSGCAELFQKNLEQWRRLGAELIEIDFAPFAESARLLYEGPWVTERFLATQALLESNPQAMHPVVREIIAPGQNTSGADAFAAQYRLAALKKLADAEMTHADLLITPTIPAQYRLQELLNDPIRLNSHLGYYTNYMNLLDYSALAVPGGFTPSGIPGGFTLVAEKFEDQRLLASARLWQSQNVEGTGAIRLATKAGKQAPYRDQRYTNVVVCGAHLEGLPLNWQLTERGATLIEKTRSSENYRLYALTDGKRPGMVRVSSDGAAIAVEVWRMPVEEFGSFVAAIPAPLGIGKVELADGRWESGFVCDGYGLEGARDITKFGGWRDYLLERAN